MSDSSAMEAIATFSWTQCRRGYSCDSTFSRYAAGWGASMKVREIVNRQLSP